MSKGEETNLARAHDAFLTVMGKFYECCACANVYEDSKTIVDMPLKAEPRLVMEEFGRLFGTGKKGPDLCGQDGKRLQTFIASWFMEAGSDTRAVSVLQRGGLSWGSELVASMLELLRRATASSESGIRSTLLPAPNPFIIPGERFRESYYWDSYWIILALLKTKDHFKVAEGIVGNFAYMVETFGLVPNGFRSYYLNRSQPPMLTAMVHALYCHTMSPKIIRTFLSVLKKELMFWRTSERTLQVTAPAMAGETYVVSRYYANWTNPRPESLREDLQTLEDLKSKIEWIQLSEMDREIMEKQLFRDISAAAESGWDFSSRWLGPDNSLSSIRTTRILPADLNALLMKSEFLVSKMAAVVGDSDTEKRFQEFGLQRLAALQAIFWDKGRSKWRDVVLDDVPHTDIKTTSGFSRQEDYASDWVPLWCMEDAVEVNILSKAVDSLRASVINAPGGIAASSIQTGQQWDWPNVWPPLQYFLAEGCSSASNLLAQAGEERLSAEAENLAESMKKRFIHAARLAWEKVHTLPEKFDCQDAGACGSGGEYELFESRAVIGTRKTMATTNSVTRNRLIEERKAWRKDRPFGFHAKPKVGDNGEVDLKLWNCIIPGKKGTIWEGGHYPLKISFSNEYPARPPKCSFDKGFYHPNIYPSGTVCLSILNEDEQWRPSITLKQILTGIQDLLDTPNEKSPAQSEAFMDFTQRRKTYERKVKEQVKKYPSPV